MEQRRILLTSASDERLASAAVHLAEHAGTGKAAETVPGREVRVRQRRRSSRLKPQPSRGYLASLCVE
jgi:hypothetical protein